MNGSGEPTVRLDATGPRPAEQELPKRIGPFLIEGVLGSGGFATVFRAVDERLGRVVALKVLRDLGASPDLVARFLREGRAAAQLDHPNVVKVYEVGTGGSGEAYIAMQLIRGGSLADYLQKAVPTSRRAADLILSISRALVHAHERGVIHRDLKPANVLLAEDETPFLTDFGLAFRPDETRLTPTGAALGTPAYMAPEQAEGLGEGTDVRTDVYGLGAILYEVLTGSPPFTGRSLLALLRQVALEPPADPRRLNPRTDRDLAAICLRCLEKEPGRRYPTAAALAEDLTRHLDGRPVEARLPGSAGRAIRWIRRNRATAAAMATTVTAVMAILGLFLRPASFSIASEPAGAALWVDGRDTGLVTPVDGRWLWPPGERAVELRLPGRVPMVERIGFSSGARVARVVDLPHRVGPCRISTRPAGAQVRLVHRSDPRLQRRFSTPVEEDVPVGDWDAIVALEGHAPLRFPVSIGEEGTIAPGGRVAVELAYTAPHVRWELQGEGEIQSSPVLTDLDRDGLPDIVLATMAGEVLGLGGRAGMPLWRRGGLGHVLATVAVADLDGDGTADVVAGDEQVLQAIDGRTGRILWMCAAGGEGDFTSSPAVGDLDGDGRVEVVAGSTFGELLVLEGPSGRTRWRREIGRRIESSPALADLDGDGSLDVVVGASGRSGGLHAVGGKDGGSLWFRPYSDANESSPTLADLDGDGVPDAAIGSRDAVRAVNGRTGDSLWTTPTRAEILASPAIADLDGDGRLEVVVGDEDGVVHALSGDLGRPRWTASLPDGIVASPALADLDGDGALDVVVVGRTGGVRALRGRDGRPIWEFTLGSSVHSTPALADLDGDGLAECVVGTTKGRLVVLAVGSGRRRWSQVGADRFVSGVALDVDRDGCRDAVVGDGVGGVHALCGRTGRTLWSDSLGGSVRLVASVEGDVVVVYGIDSVAVLSAGSGSIVGLGALEHSVTGRVAAVDIDGDGAAEICYRCTAGHSHAASVRGRSVENREVEGRTGDAFSGATATEPLVLDEEGSVGGLDRIELRLPAGFGNPLGLDLDQDDRLDAIVATRKGETCAWSRADGSRLWSDTGTDEEAVVGLFGRTDPLGPAELGGGDVDGDGIADVVVSRGRSVHVVGGVDGRPLWSLRLPARVTGRPLVADLDGDGSPEIVVGDEDGTVHCLGARAVPLPAAGGFRARSPAERSRLAALLDLDRSLAHASWRHLLGRAERFLAERPHDADAPRVGRALARARVELGDDQAAAVAWRDLVARGLPMPGLLSEALSLGLSDADAIDYAARQPALTAVELGKMAADDPRRIRFAGLAKDLPAGRLFSDPATAARDAEAAFLRDPSDVHWLGAAGHAWIAAGDPERGRRLLDAYEALLRPPR